MQSKTSECSCSPILWRGAGGEDKENRCVVKLSRAEATKKPQQGSYPAAVLYLFVILNVRIN